MERERGREKKKNLSRAQYVHLNGACLFCLASIVIVVKTNISSGIQSSLSSSSSPPPLTLSFQISQSYLYVYIFKLERVSQIYTQQRRADEKDWTSKQRCRKPNKQVCCCCWNCHQSNNAKIDNKATSTRSLVNKSTSCEELVAPYENEPCRMVFALAKKRLPKVNTTCHCAHSHTWKQTILTLTVTCLSSGTLFSKTLFC